MMQRKTGARRAMPYSSKKKWVGFLCILPWFVGFVYFFLVPFVYAFIYSISDISVADGSFAVKLVGFQQYLNAFTTDTSFLRSLSSALGSMVLQIPMILVFSMCLALILNSEIKGRTFIRGVFFLPVIIASGVIIFILNQDTVAGSMMSGSKSSALFQSIEFGKLLTSMGVPKEVRTMILNAINGIFNLVWKSGVQTLLLMTGLHSVPKYVHEAACIDGASGWERFWKITFPMVSPILSLCAFYTVVDASKDNSNVLVRYISEYAMRAQLSYSSMLSIVWCAIILVFVAAVSLLTRRFVFREND